MIVPGIDLTKSIAALKIALYTPQTVLINSQNNLKGINMKSITVLPIPKRKLPNPARKAPIEAMKVGIAFQSPVKNPLIASIISPIKVLAPE